MKLTKFNWNNGTQDSPIVLTNEQIKKLISIGKRKDIQKEIKGYITTNSRKIQKFLYYALTEQFPDLNIIHDEQLTDSFSIYTSSNIINEGNREIININTTTGISHEYLKWKYDYSDFIIDGDISEQNIKDRIHVTDGQLIIDEPQENASWSVKLILTAYPIYYNENDLSELPITSKPNIELTIKAKKIEDISLYTESEYTVNAKINITVNPIPENSTKLKGANYTYTTNTPDTVAINVFSFGTEIIAKKQGQGNVIVTLHACNNTVTKSNSVSFNIYDLRSVSFVIDQRLINNLTDPDGMVSENYVKDNNGNFIPISSCGATGDPSNNVLTWLRQNSHAYVGKYINRLDFVGYRLKQLDDTTRNKFADGTSAIDYITNDNGEYDVWLKINSDIYYKTEPYTPIGETIPNEDYVLVTIDNKLPNGENEEDWIKWDKNHLIAIYEACNINNKLYSISGKKPVNSISNTLAKNYARVRGKGFRLVTYEFTRLLALLFYGWYGTLDSQKQCGYGTKIVAENSYYPKITGLTNNLAGTDTTYETGTGSDNPDINQIIAGIGDDIKSTNFWHIENFQGDLSEHTDNIYIMETRRHAGNINKFDPKYYLSDYISSYGYPKITNLGNDYQLTPELYESLNTSNRFTSITDIDDNVIRIVQHGNIIVNTSGFIKKMCFGKHADIFFKELKGNQNICFCDYTQISNIYNTFVSSGNSADVYGGVGYLRAWGAASNASPTIGTRLLYEGTNDSIYIIDDATEIL